MKFFLSAVALIVLAGNLVSCQTSAIDDRRITLSFTEDVDLTQDDYIKHLTTRMKNTIGNVSDISVDGQTVTLTFKDVVTEIGEEAFSDFPLLASITIPNSVTEIGDGAFTGCSSLRNFSNKFASADGRCLIIDGELTAFAGDGLSNYTIPNSVTEIGNEAFANCSSLTSVTIPDSVTEIGEQAFYKCSSLTSITIPNSVTEIGDWAFGGCPLESVTVPRSAKIAKGSFEETTRVIYQ